MPCERLSRKHPAPRERVDATDPQAPAGPGLIGVAPVAGLDVLITHPAKCVIVARLHLDDLERNDAPLWVLESGSEEPDLVDIAAVHQLIQAEEPLAGPGARVGNLQTPGELVREEPTVIDIKCVRPGFFQRNLLRIAALAAGVPEVDELEDLILQEHRRPGACVPMIAAPFRDALDDSPSKELKLLDRVLVGKVDQEDARPHPLDLVVVLAQPRIAVRPAGPVGPYGQVCWVVPGALARRLPPGGAGIGSGHGGFAPARPAGGSSARLPPALAKSDSRPASHQLRGFIGASFDTEAAVQHVHSALLNHELLAKAVIT